MDTRVAVIIPTMNRSDFILRQFEFYELMNSPHPIYILDSSNEENAEKIKNEIKKFKKLNIVYQWAPPGKDHLDSLLSSVKEKYCIQIGDDDLIIPKTISECADFLENHPGYATCAGKQVNIRFKTEDYDKPWGMIDRQTNPFGRSIEHEDMFARVKDFWSDPTFICFTVTRTEIQKKIRSITRHFFLTEYATEFVLWSALIIYGKAKVLDDLGYIMQISGIRYGFEDSAGIDGFMAAPSLKEKWEIMFNGLSKIFQEQGKSEEGVKMAKWTFMLYLIHQFTVEANSEGFAFAGQKQLVFSREKLLKKTKRLALNNPLFKKIYYKFKTPQDVTRPESKYFRDYKITKDFLERKNTA